MMKSEVWVKPNSNGYITAVDGGNTISNIKDFSQWVKIDAGEGKRYAHCQRHYFPDPIYTIGGAYRYKLVDGQPVECTPEEIREQEEARKPKTIAPRNITEGEYITVNGVLCKATVNIPNGERIITGQNAIETTVEAQLYELDMKGE